MAMEVAVVVAVVVVVIVVVVAVVVVVVVVVALVFIDHSSVPAEKLATVALVLLAVIPVQTIFAMLPTRRC